MKIRSLLIGMLASIALVGCTNDDESPLANEVGKEVAVQFSVNLQGAKVSRAISDGTGATQLMYAVFEKVSETELKQVSDKKVVNDNSGQLIGDGMPVNIALLNGRTYQVVFWAQNANCGAYTVGDDMKVTVNYEGINNDESRDAFFATEQITVGTQNSFNVTLNRPFAQVNVGVHQTDYNEAIERGLTVTQSSAVIADVPNVIDLVTGNASGKVPVTYVFGNIPNEILKRVDVDNDGYHEMYKWVSMSYILASTERTTHQMRFTFRDGKNPEQDGTYFEKEASVQRNYRTNLVGQFLTTPVQLVAKIDPRYEDERSGTDKIYYIFDNETTIKDETFALTKADWGTWCVFSHYRDNQEDFVVSFDNVTFSGALYGIMLGEDWAERNEKGQPIKGKEHPTVYNFNVNNVTANGIEVANCVHNEADHMSILFYLRGTGSLIVKNSTWTGTRMNNPENMYCVTGQHYVSNSVAYDCGVPNGCKATIESSKIGSMYVWSQAQAIITGTVDKPSEIGYIRTAALKAGKTDGYLSIGANTIVDELEVTPSSGYKRIVKILAGAHVKKLKLNGHSQSDVTIEDGAIVDEIIP